MRLFLLKPGVVPAALTTLLLVLVGGGALLAVSPAPQANGSRASAPASGPAAQALTTTAAPVAPTATISPSLVVTQTDPFTVLHVFDMLPSGGVLIKESVAKLGSSEINDVLLTANVTGVATDTTGVPVTSTVGTMAVLRYDRVSGAWHVQWQTPGKGVPGAASGLPDAFPDSTRRYQTGDLLRTGQPILLLRTYDAPKSPASPPAIHLRLWAWTGDTAVPLRMTGPDGADREADFVGSSDVQTADLDDDGVIEVIVDSGAQTTVYRWDKTRFVVRP